MYRVKEWTLISLAFAPMCSSLTTTSSSKITQFCGSQVSLCFTTFQNILHSRPHCCVLCPHSCLRYSYPFPPPSIQPLLLCSTWEHWWICLSVTFWSSWHPQLWRCLDLSLDSRLIHTCWVDDVLGPTVAWFKIMSCYHRIPWLSLEAGNE